MTAIEEFFAAAEKLKKFGIIRSDKYLGDIAEFLVVSQLGMSLASSGREAGPHHAFCHLPHP